MEQNKLISIRVPVELLNKIDADAARSNYANRTSVINNILTAVYDTTDYASRYPLISWPFRKQGLYTLQVLFNGGDAAAH